MKPKRVTAVKLLIYLSPDATSMSDVSWYLYGNDQLTSKKKASHLLRGLRYKGWRITKKGMRLDERQYAIVEYLGFNGERIKK